MKKFMVITVLCLSIVEFVLATTNVDCPSKAPQQPNLIPQNYANDFTGCSWRGIDLSGAFFLHATLNEGDFTGQTAKTMDGADFRFSQMVDIKNCDINKQSPCVLSPAQAAMFLKSAGKSIDGINFGHGYPVVQMTLGSCVKDCENNCRIKYGCPNGRCCEYCFEDCQTLFVGA